jgi:hypothetical protein
MQFTLLQQEFFNAVHLQQLLQSIGQQFVSEQASIVYICHVGLVIEGKVS